MTIHHFYILLWTCLVVGSLIVDASPVSGLYGLYNAGQVFLIWEEADTPPGTAFNVYEHNKPITTANLSQATSIGHYIEPHSARDWWMDPASFDPAAASETRGGFWIASGVQPLSPASGLFVHTVTPRDTGPRYYAVTASDPQGAEDTRLTLGENSIGKPLSGKVEPARAIWIGDGLEPSPALGKGKSLVLSLHGRSGGKTAGPQPQQVNYLVFGNAKQGWREGLPFKFHVAITEGSVRITPCDRAWTGRSVLESGDQRDHCPAVNTFWYGYNSRIYETTKTPKIVAPNYTEEQLLGIVRWAQESLGTDVNRTYLVGGSMGGSGAVSMSLHYPEVFTAAVANVPVVSFTTRGGGRGSLMRLDCICGPVDETSVNQDGIPLLELMNGELQATRSRVDLPYLFMTHGRSDASIPWQNNPPFYRAMNDARQGLTAYWNNGAHGDVDRLAPDDVKAWTKRLERFALNRSFPVFTNCSDNRNPGNGDPKDGDETGWINRGLDWKDLVDTPGEYALTVTADHPDLKLPITVDITPRRVQQFRIKSGDRVSVQIGEFPAVDLRVDESGLMTFRGVSITDSRGTRIRVVR